MLDECKLLYIGKMLYEDLILYQGYCIQVLPCCREHFGPDLIIIVLTMSSADRRERILARHQGDVKTADLFDVRKYEQEEKGSIQKKILEIFQIRNPPTKYVENT